ncbi:hypothetical protein F5Y19DRAFT_465053 [Xylariaceae sp. FL1651]|nr:hypothetical protein F5Y19DRAFT_465053 [Xylariaceae sp. FL1651]
MAPIVTTLLWPDAAANRSEEEPAALSAHASSRSSSWKDKLQQRMRLRKRQDGTEKLAENATSRAVNSDQDAFDLTRQTTQTSFRNSIGRRGALPSHNQVLTLQSNSLDSLTSASLFSRNSYPSIFSTSTDATSISGVSAICGITCPVESQTVRSFKRLKNNTIIYLAQDDVKLPPDVVEQWETTDLDRLKTDLGEVVMEVYRKGVNRESRRPRSTFYLTPGAHEYDISFELRMSGRAPRDAQHVALVPSIWIICGSTWACKDVRTAMEAITWPMLPLEIHEGRGPLPSVTDGQVDIDKLDLTDGFSLGNGITLYIHIEDSLKEASLCGLICCATIKDGDTYSHRFSRIGGLLSTTNTLASAQFGISTAHGMLDHPWWHEQLRRKYSADSQEYQSIDSDDDEDEDDQESLYAESQSSPNPNPDVPFIPLVENRLCQGYRDPQLVSRWRNVSHHGVVSFLGGSMPTDGRLRRTVQLHDETANPTDHAMIPVEWPPDSGSTPFNNSYCPKGVPPERAIDIVTHMSNDKLIEGPVSILCESHAILDGRLLPGSTCLTMGGRMFTLRKLKTAAPLARGISGTWVARNKELCGMIIAVSALEPYAYMMPADELFSNIEASSPSIETVDVFNSFSRHSKQRQNGPLRQIWPSRKPQHLLATAVSTPKTVDERHPVTDTKAGLSTKLRRLTTFSRISGYQRRSHSKQELSTRSHQKRPIYSRLSGMFSTRIEEIIPPTGLQDFKVDGVSKCGYREYLMPVTIKRSIKPRQKYRPPITLEPISETASAVAQEPNNMSEPEYVFLKSTPYTITTTFRQGPIQLCKSDVVPGREPDITEDLDCAEYKTALSSAVEHWFSDHYDTELEQEIDELDDLIDWWESWGFGDYGGLIVEDGSEPSSPTSTTNQDFPDASYSDTTSEDSASSSRAWSAQSHNQDYFPDYVHEDESQDVDQVSRDKSSEDGDSKPNSRFVCELATGENLTARIAEPFYEQHLSHDLIV